MENGQHQRLYYLDAVRSIALLLGVIFHASLSFMPIFIGWAVMDISTSYAVAVFVFVSHTFRMPLFFLIAGYFTCMSLQRSHIATFVKSRAIKLALPLIVGWFVLRPLIVSGWVAGGQSMQGEVDIAFAFLQGLDTFNALPSGFLVGTHLWFLYYLLLITASFLAIRFTLNKVNINSARLGAKLVSWCWPEFNKDDTQTHRLILVPVTRGLVFILPTALSVWFMQGWGIDTPDKSLYVHWPVFLLYFGWFSLGYVLYSNLQAFTTFTKVTVAKVCIGTVALITAVALTPYEMQKGHPYFIQLKMVFCICYALVMWALVPLAIAMCKKLFSKKRAWVRYVADASYWTYLIHLPIVVGLQVAVAELPLHWAVKWFSICAVTVCFALVTYALLVRKTLIGRVLTGNIFQKSSPSMSQKLPVQN